ncbi:MAG: DUF6702 family protein [Crocinitomicaceae bacterium]
MKITLLILLCGLQSLAFGHDYYFAFAEVEYNDMSQKFEATVSMSAHDLERTFDEKNWSIDALEFPEKTANFEAITKWVLTQFVISSNEKAINFDVIGCEVELSGMIRFYLESAPVSVSTALNVQFNLLMEEFPEQQNKLTLYYRDQTITKSFFPSAFVQEIRLENS